MQFTLKHYYQVKLVLAVALHSFIQESPKDDYEEYARKIIGRSYNIIQNKIDELDRTNELVWESYRKNIENFREVRYSVQLRTVAEICKKRCVTFCE